MEREEMYFNLDYRGWLNRTRRSFNEVISIFRDSECEKFAAWADNAKYGDKTNIGGVNIELVPPLYEIRDRCRYYIQL